MDDGNLGAINDLRQVQCGIGMTNKAENAPAKGVRARIDPRRVVARLDLMVSDIAVLMWDILDFHR
jgi:hypothetical protein